MLGLSKTEPAYFVTSATRTLKRSARRRTRQCARQLPRPRRRVRCRPESGHSDLAGRKVQAGTVAQGPVRLLLRGRFVHCAGTVKDKETDKLNHDIYYWLGKKTSQDEMGISTRRWSWTICSAVRPSSTARLALRERPVQGALQGAELPKGRRRFRLQPVEPNAYTTKLLHVKKVGKTTSIIEVPCNATASTRATPSSSIRARPSTSGRARTAHPLRPRRTSLRRI